MKGKREKTRTDHLADIHDQLRSARGSVAQIDLRKLRGEDELRNEIKGIREDLDQLLTRTNQAIQMDAPLANAV